VVEALVFDAVVAEAAGGVAAKRLHVARHQLHRRQAAVLDFADELVAALERGAVAPEPEPLGIGEVLDLGGAGRRQVDDPGVGEPRLQLQPGKRLLRRVLLAEGAFLGLGVGHVVGFVEGDDAVEVGAEPVDELVDAGVGDVGDVLLGDEVGHDRDRPFLAVEQHGHFPRLAAALRLLADARNLAGAAVD
jgi:hypothetical protein